MKASVFIARKGFTLVELSIVLIVIGLLIGGILAANSMITTSRVQSAVKQISNFEVAVSNFRTKFNSLPGDSGLFGGNNDGKIDGLMTGESANFWPHLVYSGLKPENVTGYSNDFSAGAVLSGSGANTPTSPLDSKRQTSVIATLTNQVDTQLHRNAYLIGGNCTAALCSPSIDSSYSIPFDCKIDDCTAETGAVIMQTSASLSFPGPCNENFGIPQEYPSFILVLMEYIITKDDIISYSCD